MGSSLNQELAPAVERLRKSPREKLREAVARVKKRDEVLVILVDNTPPADWKERGLAVVRSERLPRDLAEDRSREWRIFKGFTPLITEVPPYG